MLGFFVLQNIKEQWTQHVQLQASDLEGATNYCLVVWLCCLGMLFLTRQQHNTLGMGCLPDSAESQASELTQSESVFTTQDPETTLQEFNFFHP